MNKVIILTVLTFLVSSCSHIQVAVFKYEDLCQEDIMRGRYNEAETSCGLCEDYGQSAICVNNLGIVSITVHSNFEKAEEYFEEALGLDKTFVQSVNNLGVLNHMQGNYNKAISYYMEALRLVPDYYDSLYNLSRAYTHLGDEVNAKIWMEKAEIASGI